MITFPKDQHGLQIWDINHKDKQNFEAVMRITHPTFQKVLQQKPGAQQAIKFLHVLRCFADSYIDENHTSTTYTQGLVRSLFCRCWHKWVMNSKEQYNFIIENIIELNAHSLITPLLTACKSGYSLLLWLYGSQSCEKLFQTIGNMGSTFSTIVNLGCLV